MTRNKARRNIVGGRTNGRRRFGIGNQIPEGVARDSRDDEEQGKPELILASVGLLNKEIAEILGKSPDAVSKVIQRAGKKTAKGRK